MSKNAGHTPQISVAPTIEKRKVPLRLANAVYRSREYLTDAEVTALMKTAAHVGRHGMRDAALILVAYRHGLRVSELVNLRWDQVDLQQDLLHVARRKNGIASVRPLRGPELRTLRRLQRDYPHTAYVFVSERKAPLTVDVVLMHMQQLFEDWFQRAEPLRCFRRKPNLLFQRDSHKPSLVKLFSHQEHNTVSLDAGRSSFFRNALPGEIRKMANLSQ